MNTPTDSEEQFQDVVRWFMEYGQHPHADSWFERLAIEERNEILDEIARIEEKSEALAEERRRGAWAIPSHMRHLV